MGVPCLILCMFIRKKRNKSGSISIQIISKSREKYKVEKTIGSSSTQEGITLLLHQVKNELQKIQRQTSLFVSEDDANIESFLNILKNIYPFIYMVNKIIGINRLFYIIIKSGRQKFLFVTCHCVSG